MSTTFGQQSGMVVEPLCICGFLAWPDLGSGTCWVAWKNQPIPNFMAGFAFCDRNYVGVRANRLLDSG